MSLYRGVSAGVVSSAVMLLSASTAFAQDPPVEPAPVAAPTAETTAAPEPAPEPAPAPVAETPAEEAAEEAAAAEEAVEEAAAAEDEEDGPFSYMVFADAYANVQTSATGADVPFWRAYAGSSPGRTTENGFSLNFAGVDLAYSSEKFGVTTSLRFGPGVPKFYLADVSGLGLDSITQAFATWKPSEKLTLDFGMFGTIYGAEVAESWVNLNYTRGALYYAMQPFWHTGLRAALSLSDTVTLKGLLVNDANQISLDPAGDLQAGLQLAVSTDSLGLYIGTLQTLGEQNAFVDRFFDVVLTYGAGDFTLVFNGDLNIDDAPGEIFGGPIFYGLSLAAGYSFSPAFGLAGRFEWLDNDTDVESDELITGTLTFDVKPVKDMENVVLRWDNRIEATTSAFAVGGLTDGGGLPTDLWFQSTLGLAVHADGIF